MSMQCKICSNPQRLIIDRQIVKSGNLAKIAKEFGVPYSSLYSHAQNHISRQLAQVWDKRDVEAQFDLLNKIDLIISRAEDIFTRNYNKNKDTVALKALDSQRNTIELLAKISYSLHQAKLAEVELARLQSDEHDEQAEIELQEQLNILSTPELKMLMALQDKIINQSKKIIIPEEKKIQDPVEEDYLHFEEEEEDEQSITRLKRTKSNRMSVHAIKPEQIPFKDTRRIF